MDIISDSSSSTPVKQSLNDLIDVVGFDADLALTPNIKNEFTFGSNWDHSVRQALILNQLQIVNLTIRPTRVSESRSFDLRKSDLFRKMVIFGQKILAKLTA